MEVLGKASGAPGPDIEAVVTPRSSQLATSDPNEIVYEDLKYSIKVKDSRTKKMVDKPILRGLTGYIAAARLTAVMGASGAGKTSFLNVLAGHVHGGAITLGGSIRVNGEAVSPDKMRRISGFVHQEDVVLGTMSVGEALCFAAALRLPASMSHEEKVQRAISVADMLNLTKAWDSLFGSNMIKGISGGEKRRLSLGMELITNPAILYLDEPTSGLDTFNAFKVAQLCGGLAHTYGRTVVATVHQPSSEIFRAFDDLLVLAEGSVLYAGRAADLVPYFDRLGYTCPTYTNPADFLFMDVLHGGAKAQGSMVDLVGAGLEAAAAGDAARGGSITAGSGKSTVQLADAAAQRAVAEQARIGKLTDAWLSSPEAATQLQALKGGRGGGITATSIQSMAPLLTQLRQLAGRAGRNAWRNKLILKGKLAQTLFLALLVGLIYLRIGNGLASVQNRTGALFFLTVNSMFGSVMGTLTVFGAEKAVFLREYSARMYHLPAYFWSRWLVQLPILVFSPMLYACIVYWMIGFQAQADKFFWFVLVLVLLDNCGASLGILTSCMFNDIGLALAVVPAVLLPLMVFSGFFVNSNSIPPYFSWIQYLSPMRYGFIALATNEFTGLTIYCEPGQVCPPNGDAVLVNLGFSGKGGVSQNAGVLFALMVGFLLLAYVALWASVRRLTR